MSLICRSLTSPIFLALFNKDGVGTVRGCFNVALMVGSPIAGLLAEDGAALDAIHFCPHHPSSPDPAQRQCSCRKPKPGMLLDLAREHNIDMSASAMIGDRVTDIEAGEAAGVRAFLFDGGNLDTLMLKVLASLKEARDGEN